MNLDAGRALDAQIATAIFGYTLDYEFDDLHGAPTVPELRDQYDEWGILPHYSTDMTDAWLVVEALHTRGLWFDIGTTVEGSMDAIRAAELDLTKLPRIWGCYVNRTIVARATTAPLAICRAALKAVNHGKSE